MGSIQSKLAVAAHAQIMQDGTVQLASVLLDFLKTVINVLNLALIT